jgi:hypothetical protein
MVLVPTSLGAPGAGFSLLATNQQQLDVKLIDTALAPTTGGKGVFWFAKTPVPLAQQDGTFFAPYASLQTAINAAGATGGTVYALGKGDVTQSATFDGAGVNNSLEIVAFQGNDSRDPVLINVLTLQNHCHVTVSGIIFNQNVITQSRLWANYCGSGQITADSSNIRWRNYQAATPGDLSVPWALANVSCLNGTTFAAFGMIIAGNIVIGSGADPATTENMLQQCTCTNGLSLFVSNVATVVNIDEFTLKSSLLVAGGYDFVTNMLGLLVVLNADRPSMLLGAPAGAIAADSFLTPWQQLISATEAQKQIPQMTPRLLRSIRAATATGGNIATANCILTLRKNGADTALTCTMNVGQNVASDLQHLVKYNATDKFSLKVTGNGTVIPANGLWVGVDGS